MRYVRVPFIAVLFILIVGVHPSRAEETPNVLTILRQMKSALEPREANTRRIIISAMDSEGKMVQWTAAQARKVFPDGKRLLMVILEPKNLRGTAFLIWEHKDSPCTIYVYQPALRRVRLLSQVEIFDRFSGTEFTYADLGFIRLHEQYRLLGKENSAGVPAYQVEEIGSNGRSYYSRIITWAAIDSSLPVKREYYDNKGNLWKTEVFKDFSIIDGVTPLRIVMKDAQQGFSTELKIIKLNYYVKIPDELFNPIFLSKAVNSPLWQTHKYLAAERGEKLFSKVRTLMD